MSSVAATALPREHPRTIGWLGTVALAMGGSNQSLFLLAALLATQATGAIPLLIFGLILSWAALPGWIELIMMWPNRVGGIAATCAEAFRPYSPVLANLTGVAYWWGWIPTCGLTAILSATALHHWYLPGVPTTLLAVIIVLTFTAVNLIGVKWATRVAIPIAFASALLALLSVLIPVFSGSVDWQQAASFDLDLPFDGVFGWITSAMAGIYLIGFAAPAFEAAACHVGETKDPNKNVPKAMYRAAGMAGLYFIAIPIIWLGVIGPDGLKGDLMLTLGPTFAPLLGGAAKAAAIWFMVFNMFHGTLQPLAGAARTMSQLSEDGLLPKAIAKRNRYDAPWVATWMTAAFAICFLLLGDPIWIIAAANFCYLIGIAMPSIAVWLLRRNAPEMERPYRAPRGTIVLGVIAAGTWLVSTVLGLQQFDLPTVLAALGMAYSGSLLYAWRRWRDHVGEGQRPGDFFRSLHAKLTGAMVLVMILDGIGYLLAIRHVPEKDAMLVAVLKDIFVAVAILTVTVGLVLPGMIAHAVQQVATAAQRLGSGTIADLTGAMRSLGKGDLDAAHADGSFEPVDVRSRDEVGQMAEAFNAMQHDVAEAALALDDAREGVRTNREELAQVAARQSLVASLGERALQGLSVEELMSEVLERSRVLLGADAATVTQRMSDGRTARILAAVGIGRPGRHEVFPSPVDPEHEIPPMLREMGNAHIALPITGRSGPYGWVSAHWNDHHETTTGERDFLQAIANLLANAIERDSVEQEIRHQALHDPLTGLPNRTLFVDRLDLALAQCERRGSAVAVLFMDFDHFKVINDSLGHTVGDQLLKAVSDRLVQILRPGDTVARFGGDEFVIICDDLASPGEAEQIAQRTLAALARPFALASSEHTVSASIGIALAHGIRRAPEDLVREADAAMYRAKEKGRGRYELYDEIMRARAFARLRTETELRAALENDELLVHYQPIVELATGRMRGVEALVRWMHPERGLVSPDEFIPVAEETGVIVPLGAWVLQEACRQVAEWHAARPDSRPIRCGVNLSARQVVHPAIVDMVDRAVKTSGIDPSAVVLEITESVLMDDPEQGAATLRRLKDLGVHIALDDFGTGYSSLAYVRRFPIDILKIDREFISGLGTDDAIVEAVLAMGRNMNIDVVAEGVETAEQEDALRALHCVLAQGYRYARPAVAAEIEPLIDVLLTGRPEPDPV
jgi:diguanylate cyclase (GGDEF)-like protein